MVLEHHTGPDHNATLLEVHVMATGHSTGRFWRGARRITKTPEFVAWRNMIARCHDPRDRGYHRYGDRGIAVCDRWRGEDGFANFLADMGSRPSAAHSLERRDNEKGYDKDNCEWATWPVQCRNRRSNRMVTHNGETLCVTEWAERLGIDPKLLLCRLLRGWSHERALTTPVNAKHRRKS